METSRGEAAAATWTFRGDEYHASGWTRRGRTAVVEAARRSLVGMAQNDTPFLIHQNRLVFARYDEQLYLDLKAHQDARVARAAAEA